MKLLCKMEEGDLDFF